MREIIMAAKEFGAAYAAGTTEAKAFLAFWLFVLVGVPTIAWLIEKRTKQLKARRRVRQYTKMIKELELRQFNLMGR